MEHLISTVDLGQCEPLDQKGKPKRSLRDSKGGKRPNEKSFFLGEIERLRESKRRRKFPFSEEGFAAKKRHDFQGKSWARISRQPTVRINPYGTDLVQPQFIVSVLATTAARFFKEKAHLLVCTDRTTVVQQQQFLGTIFRQSVQSVRYGCLCIDFEVAVLGFFLYYFKHGNRGKR
jgi:hypothetical protein